MLDVEDLVFAAIQGSGGRIEGRTRLQKLVYFAASVLRIDVGYRPHYYGPYSSAVTAVAESQAARGVLNETVESFAGVRGFPGNDDEFRRYLYVLTEGGRKALEWRRARRADEFDKAAGIVRTLVDTGADYRVLSYAAKLFHILLAEECPLTADAARQRAKELGWHMTRDEMQQGVELLLKVRLIVEADTSGEHPS
jgi:uncharacterized protein YwgA